MTLDLNLTSLQVMQMAGDLAATAQRMRAVPKYAESVMRIWHERAEEAQAYLDGVGSGGVWPFAVPIEPLLTVSALPSTPQDCTVIAVDGSQIDVDSHGLVHCMLVNTGWAGIRYGPQPEAWLASSPQVLHQDQDTYLAADEGPKEPVDEHSLSLLRTVAEIERLADLAAEWSERPALVAMADGSLVRWEFGGRRPDPARLQLLRRYTAALARFRELRVPVCSYISRPNAREVANALSLLSLQSCQGAAGSCEHCRRRPEALCTVVRHLPDRALFPHVQRGSRSALFRAQSPILEHYPTKDRAHFFYLRLSGEVARIELPAWCLERPYIDRLHAVVHDQCERGRGYPVALMEAHEQAVIHGQAREAFRMLVLQAMNERDLEAAVSQKRLSKDHRAV